jgi:hypothetical protein
MCTVLLPSGDNRIAVDKYIISYHIISYHIISYHIISYIISYHITSYRIISYYIISSYHITFLPWWRLPCLLATISLSQSYSSTTMISEDPRKVPGGPDEEREGLQRKSPAGRKLQSAGVSLLRLSWWLYLRADMSGSTTACDLEAVSTGSGLQ